MNKGKVALCVPSLAGPTQPFIEAMDRSVPLLIEAGWDPIVVEERQNPYISAARAIMLRKAIDAGAETIVFLDYDLSWGKPDLLTLIETPGDVVAGVYRFKKPDVEYMGSLICREDGRPQGREDGCLKGYRIPAGFLKITTETVHKFMRAYPHLTFGPAFGPSVDLFNHGAIDGLWYGEDYAFSRNWLAMGEDIWIVPDLDIAHHNGPDVYPGNFHQFLMACPGGANDPARPAIAA